MQICCAVLVNAKTTFLSHEYFKQEYEAAVVIPKFEYLRWFMIVVDIVMLFNFWTLNYHYILWKKTNDTFSYRGVDVIFKRNDRHFSWCKFLKNLFHSYKYPIILSFVLFLKPYEKLNNIANQFDPNSRFYE